MGSSGEWDALVIGAGVTGLTTAIRLAEAGLRVRIRAARPPHETTSAAAGASWGPYLVNDARVLLWSEQTRLALEKLSEDPTTGVRLVRGIEASPHPVEAPSWMRGISDFEHCSTDDLPPGYACGWRYTIPLIRMPQYLDYLVARLRAARVPIEIAPISSFHEVRDSARVLVNCTGLGARRLVPDDEVFPTRGQLVVVDNPGIDHFFQDHTENEDLTYFLPHGDCVVLGGSAMPRSESLVPDPAATRAILDRCAAVEPRLRDAPVRRVLVGLRPSRSRVRVEWGTVDGVPVLHNYGHGGSGVTLSWGCADEVLSLSGLQ